MPCPRVLILYNEPVLPADDPLTDSETEVLEAVERYGRALRQAGYSVGTLGVGEDPRALLSGLTRRRPDVVFNLFEGLPTQAGTEATVVGLLEWLGVPCTGCPAAALSLALDKYRTKQLLRGAGLPTPAFAAVERLPAPPWPGPWPAIVKPARQDASVGIEQASVVTTPAQLEARCAHVLARYGAPALVEQFVPGREFHVHLLEGTDQATGERSLLMLPLAEIVFLDHSAGYWPIYSYDAKWDAGSHEYQATPLESPVFLEPGPTERLAEVVRRAYDLVGCRDYARLDVRMDPDGRFFLLEINPNPFLNSKGVINGLRAVGRSQRQFFLDLVRAALGRRRAA